MSVETVDKSSSAEFFSALNRLFHSQRVTSLVDEADKTGIFPRPLIELLGAEGILNAIFELNAYPDLNALITLDKGLGRLGSAGVSAGISLHNSALAILRRFGRNQCLSEITKSAISGKSILCIGASETGGGSDLQSIRSSTVKEGDGYRLRGHKKFVSLSPRSDYVILAVRGADSKSADKHGNIALFAVPTSNLSIGTPYRKVGAHSLETAPVTFDTWLPAEMMIARPGTGLAALSWGLTHERLSIAGQVAGACELALGVTVARMHVREQFGKSLFEHQALRQRIADLASRVDILHLALTGIAAQGSPLNLRTAAGIKVTAARLGQEVIAECMHIFGGAGYLSDETPLGRWWQDMKLARVGSGVDEVLWELVAGSLIPDYDNYNRLVRETS